MSTSPSGRAPIATDADAVPVAGGVAGGAGAPHAATTPRAATTPAKRTRARTMSSSRSVIGRTRSRTDEGKLPARHGATTSGSVSRETTSARIVDTMITPRYTGRPLRVRDQSRIASSNGAGRGADRNAPRRQATKRAIDTTATMIVEMALIWGETPSLMAL